MWSPLHKRPETPFASFPGTCVPSTPYIFTDIYLTFISTPLFRSSAFSNCRQGPLCLLAVYLVAHLVGFLTFWQQCSQILKRWRDRSSRVCYTNLRSRMQHGYEGNRSENEHNRFGKIIYLKQCKASLEDHQAREIDN